MSVPEDIDAEICSVNIKIPKNDILVGVTVLCKYMDEDGNIHYTEGGDKAISTVETLGMVTAYADVLKSKLSKSQRS